MEGNQPLTMLPMKCGKINKERQRIPAIPYTTAGRVGIKKPTQKNPPKKTQKNPPKKTH